jgi:cell wall-associated NlpC family hydrolase
MFIVFCLAGFTSQTFGQERERVVQDQPNQPNQRNSNETTRRQIPTLENKIVIQTPTVKKTSSSQPINAPISTASKKSRFSAVLKSQMLKSIQNKLGIPYRYGSNGPRSYDCSSFVWAVFGDVGIDFTRTSARSYWQTFEPVTGDDRYKFGTLVFFNRLGHVGIVVDEEGFYHASSSNGVTYSKFEGYWEKRITGFRRIPLEDYLY